MFTDVSGVSGLQKVAKREEGRCHADGGAGKNQPQGGENIPEWKQLQPIKEERRNPGDPSEQAGCQGDSQGQTPDEEIDEMDSPS
jgi:hypothetical protein